MVQDHHFYLTCNSNTNVITICFTTLYFNNVRIKIKPQIIFQEINQTRIQLFISQGPTLPNSIC